MIGHRTSKNSKSIINLSYSPQRQKLNVVHNFIRKAEFLTDRIYINGVISSVFKILQESLYALELIKKKMNRNGSNAICNKYFSFTNTPKIIPKIFIYT